MPDVPILSTLSARKPGLDTLEPAWKLIDDVLASRIKRHGANGWYSAYFPKGRLEPDAEYSLRIELTPFFPQTPQLLASRLGALFKTRPQFEGINDARYQAFIAQAGRRHASFEDFAVQAACLAQSHGFCAALLDRDPLPENLVGPATVPAGRAATGRDAGATIEAGATNDSIISAAEAAARNLGRPYLALYGASEILDWDHGSDGRLSWVKFCEQETSRSAWDSPAHTARVYRIVDRQAIHVFRVRRDARGEWSVQAETPIAHGFEDEVPVVFLHPFPSREGIGQPLLQRCAEADVAAARILSDLIWDLFLLGNPILTLKTGRSDEQLMRLGLGATRYIPLRNGKPGEENPEELKFVQLDPTGIDFLFRAHGLFAAQAQKQASGDDSALPLQQSGVALAWRFKTGEERVLFMLARALEPFLSGCLKLAGQALGILPSGGSTGLRAGETPVVRMPESFDVSTPQDTLDSAQKILSLARELKQTELAKVALQRIEGTLGVLPPQTREALRRERESLVLHTE